jgi:hypothetical protein
MIAASEEETGGIARSIRMIPYFALALSIASMALLGAVAMQMNGMGENDITRSDAATTSVGPASLPQEFQRPPVKPVIPMDLLVGEVMPSDGIQLPVKFGSTVAMLVQESALNATFLKQVMNQTGERFSTYEENVLSGSQNENVILNASDSSFILNVLWAVGINNDNAIINKGQIMRSSNPLNFASTGGYGQLGKLSLGKLNLLTLTRDQQIIAEQVAANTYRPCCDNPASFPDCNHGSAAVGLIELMASQGFNSTTIFGALKQFESFYFPQAFIYESVYFYASQGDSWTQVPAEQALSYYYSSRTGAVIMQQYLIAYHVGTVDFAQR